MVPEHDGRRYLTCTVRGPCQVKTSALVSGTWCQNTMVAKSPGLSVDRVRLRLVPWWWVLDPLSSPVSSLSPAHATITRPGPKFARKHQYYEYTNDKSLRATLLRLINFVTLSEVKSERVVAFF